MFQLLLLLVLVCKELAGVSWKESPHTTELACFVLQQCAVSLACPSLWVVRWEWDLVEVTGTVCPKLVLVVPKVLVKLEDVVLKLSVSCCAASECKLVLELLAEPSVKVRSEGSVVKACHVGPVGELHNVPIHQVAVHHAK